MSAIFIAMGASFLVAITFLILYLISVKKGQFEDTYTPSVRILFDDEELESVEEETSEQNSKNKTKTKIKD